VTRLLLRVSVAHGGGSAPTKGRPKAIWLCGRINSEKKRRKEERRKKKSKKKQEARRRR